MPPDFLALVFLAALVSDAPAVCLPLSGDLESVLGESVAAVAAATCLNCVSSMSHQALAAAGIACLADSGDGSALGECSSLGDGSGGEG